jgi:hypothetical protein
MQNMTKNMQNNMQNMQKKCQKICKPVFNMQNTDMSIFCIFCIYTQALLMLRLLRLSSSATAGVSLTRGARGVGGGHPAETQSEPSRAPGDPTDHGLGWPGPETRDRATAAGGLTLGPGPSRSEAS